MWCHMALAIQIILGISIAVFTMFMLYICYYFGVCTPCGIEHGPLVTVHREHVTIVKPGRALNWLPDPEVASVGQQVTDEEIAMHSYQPNIGAVIDELNQVLKMRSEVEDDIKQVSFAQ